MARALRPTKIQLTLLATAADRADGNVFPVDERVAHNVDEVEAAITELLLAGLIVEPEDMLVRIWRDRMKELIELRITKAGRELVNSACRGQEATRRSTKTGAVLTMLMRDGGASAAELIAATGWQAHTIRAVLSTLRKRGHAVERCRRDELACYRLAA